MEKKPTLPILIGDLIDLIHMVIIKGQGENEIILKEISSIDEKIQSGQLKNYDVTHHPFWKTWENKRKEEDMKSAFIAGMIHGTDPEDKDDTDTAFKNFLKKY